MRIAIGADHAGLPLKQELTPWLEAQGHVLQDVGAHDFHPGDDYPDYAEAVARAVADGEVTRGIMVCGSGVGACVTTNKVRGVRACMCHDTYSAHQGVEHDDMNVLCLGARIIGGELAREVVTAFLGAQFSGEERHQRRLDKLLAIERNNLAKDG